MPVMTSLPFPSNWIIDAWVGGRPLIHGRLIINSITNNRVTGTVNFRGVPMPIQGYWNESMQQLTFQSPYAQFYGVLTTFNELPIRMRHYILKGSVKMMPPSIRAGEQGTWLATTEIVLNPT